MRLGQSAKDKQRRLKPPPDYSSRRMQWRLLAAVSSLMLVVVLATEARNPAHWQWLTNIDRLVAPAAEDDTINPRLIEPAKSTDSEEVIVSERSRPKTTEPLAAESDSVSAHDRAWASGWNEVFDKLSNTDRQAVYEVLKAARDAQPLQESQVAAANEVVAQLDRHWAEYRAEAGLGIQDLTEEDRAAWLPVLEQLEVRWTVETKPLFMILAQRESLSSSQREALAGLQHLLDGLELKAVQDNTPWRASEREIWFRLLGQLQKRTPEELERASQGLIGYAALFKQSAAFRGKLITVRGTARDVYWVNAPANAYGIERYWVYWLRPEGGPNSPIEVFALSKPEGFPFVDISESGRNKMPAYEDVEFTGFYFKRHAYEGQGGIFTAPMLLAKEPKWLTNSLSSRTALPSPLTFLAVVAGLALLATALALWVYYQYRPGRMREAQLPSRISYKPHES